jgi:GT2 family glycosyltransferase
VDLSIISVNYNSLDYLRPCIAGIYQWTRGISFEIIVVDNGSPKGDVDQLKAEFPDIKIVKSCKNLGFAGANNLGFKHSCGDWVLFLNPDTKLTSPALNVMLDRARTMADLGLAGCRLLNADGSVQTSSIMNFPRILNSIVQIERLRLRWPRLLGIGPLFSENPAPIRVEAVSGACMLTKSDVFEQISMFSEDYFMYSEDVDLCYKADRAGLKNYYLGQASMIHYGGTSSDGERQTSMKTRAELLFCEKNYGRSYTRAFRAALALNAVARLMTIAIMSCFGSKLSIRYRLESARARWTCILKTLLAREHLIVSSPSNSAGYSATSA